MQITETEIIIPLKGAIENVNIDRWSPRRLLVESCVWSIPLFGFGIFGLVFLPFSIIHIIFILSILTSLIVALTIPLQIRQLRAGPAHLCISHEGILCSNLFPWSLRWDDIATLFLYTWKYFGSRQALGIVPRDFDALCARFIEEHSRNAWYRACYSLLLRVSIWIYRRSKKTLAPIHILQMTLPISLDELMAIIQERFATELREHHITVLGWQN